MVRCEYLSLNDGKIDFNLVQPAGMDRQVDQYSLRPCFLKSFDSGLTPMRRTIINDPKDPGSGPVWFLIHDLVHQTHEGLDPGLWFHATEYSPTMNIPSSQIVQSTFAQIFMLDHSGFPRPGSNDGMAAASGLDTGFLISRQDEVSFTQRLPFPNTLIEVKNRRGPFHKSRITGKDPASIIPRANGIRVQPAPQSASADLSDDPPGKNLLENIVDAESGQWNPVDMGKLTC